MVLNPKRSLARFLNDVDIGPKTNRFRTKRFQHHLLWNIIVISSLDNPFVQSICLRFTTHLVAPRLLKFPLEYESTLLLSFLKSLLILVFLGVLACS